PPTLIYGVAGVSLLLAQRDLPDFIAKGELSMNRGLQVDRRKFLGAAAAVGAGSALKSSPIKALTQRASITPREFKQRLRGAVVHLVTPFTADYKVDVAGLRRMIQRALDNGLTVFELTDGDGRLWALNYEEMKLVARTMSE